MRRENAVDRARLVDAAMQRVRCDLTVENVKLVNVFTGEVYPASVDVCDGVIVRVREPEESLEAPSARVYDGGGRYLLPGFIDAHVHIESTMMIPENFARVAVPWGVTAVCTDPHEIGNVKGTKGVEFMLENARRTKLRHFVLAPSCVPAVPELEGAGASFDAKDVASLLDAEDVVGVAEIMDYVGVYNNSVRMRSIIDEGVKRNVLLQGHAPFCTGKELAAYLLGGSRSDHESTTEWELIEKLRGGMNVNLRASSIEPGRSDFLNGIRCSRWLDNISICADDVHAKDVLERDTINYVIKLLLEDGWEPIDVMKLATINAAREYGFKDLGAVAPGYLADMQLVDEPDGRRPAAVFIGGELVAENGEYIADGGFAGGVVTENTVNMPQIQSPDDFSLRAPEGCKDSVEVTVMCRIKDSVVRTKERMTLPVKDGCVSLEGFDDLQFVCVANRYGSGDKAIAVVKGFGLKTGALATTVSHDSHNFTVFYKNALDAYLCAEELKRTGGGMCAANGGELISTLPLPVAGLMSTLPCGELSEQIENTENAMLSICDDSFRFLSAAVFALPVLPGLILTDRGLVDGLTQEFVELF